MKNADVIRNMTDSELATLLADFFMKGVGDAVGNTNLKSGVVINRLEKALQKEDNIVLTCPKCHGEGCYLVKDEDGDLVEQYCFICDGDGKVTDERYKYYEKIKSKGHKK